MLLVHSQAYVTIDVRERDRPEAERWRIVWDVFFDAVAKSHQARTIRQLICLWILSSVKSASSLSKSEACLGEWQDILTQRCPYVSC